MRKENREYIEYTLKAINAKTGGNYILRCWNGRPHLETEDGHYSKSFENGKQMSDCLEVVYSVLTRTF